MKKTINGFTMIELLIVIAIIGVISTIGVVVYNGVMRNTRNSQRETQMSAISNALEKYYDDNSEYPGCSDMASSDAGEILGINQGLFVSPGSDPADNNSFIDNCGSFSDDGSYDEFVYDGDGCTDEACLEYDLNYYEEGDDEGWIDLPSDEIMTPDEVASLLDCPSGFIKVPGSKTYDTTAFCAMKYEAKNINSIAISQPEGLPWVSINQTAAKTAAKEACDGCHLTTEAEWMTLAQNVLSVDSNWSGGVVGTGYIYSGHNDFDPDAPLPAGDDNNPYVGTNDFAGDLTKTHNAIGDKQRRTLTLNNGQVIWDMAGNVIEWTSGTSEKPIIVPGITGSGAVYLQWPEVTNPGTLPINPAPASTELAGASTWSSSNGIGSIYTNSDETSLRAFTRGGGWHGVGTAGVLNIVTTAGPTAASNTIGFRVTR